jgi:NitT/TauT family transport system substrate-binding protein
MRRQCYLALGLLIAVLAACTPSGASSPTGAKPGGAAAPPGATAAAPAQPAPAAAPSGPLSPPVKVRFGDLTATANAGYYIAQARGYFRDEGLDVTFETFDTCDRAIPPLATNQLDVVGCGLNAAVLSAMGRGLPIKIVAGVSRNEPGFSSSALVVRKELIDSGRVRDYPDLRGLRIAVLSLSSGLGSEYRRVLEKGGLTDDDVDLKLMPFPDAAVALGNGGVDVAVSTEPFVARMVQSGAAVRWKGADEIYPDHQITTILYGPEFYQRQPEAAVRFLVAYIRGARDFRAFFKEGADRTPLYQILAEYTPIKDLSIYPAMQPSGIHPDAALNVQSVAADQDLWASQGFVEQKADLATAVDLQYLQAALRRLDGAR